MRKIPNIRSLYMLLISASVGLAACGPSAEQKFAMTAVADTAKADSWTWTPSPTETFTPSFTTTETSTYTPSFTPTSSLTPTFTFTPTYTFTPTFTFTPTITSTFTITPSPTFDFPKVTVNKGIAACLFGPSKAYLYARDLFLGDIGVVWGRAPYGSKWLYVKMDKWPQNPCWVSPYVVDVVGDVNKMLVQKIRLPVTNALYAPPTNIKAVREGDQVTVSWDPVWMTLDDDRGYFLEVWVCQGGYFVWVTGSLPNQYVTQYTFTDGGGCSTPSYGEIRTVEKHGYTDPAPIPWPPY